MHKFPPPVEAQVTLANWRTGPFNRWAFHHVREIVPTAEIRNDAGAVSPLPGGASLSIPPILYDGEAIEYTAFLESTCTDGLIILRDGKVVHEDYPAAMRSDDPHILMSVSKSMLGLVAGILADQGVLDLQASAETYVPELKDTSFKSATIQQLLDMRTGIRFNEDYAAADGAMIAYRKSTNWNPLDPTDTPLDLREFLLTLTESDGPHGGDFDYKSPCTDLLGWIIERATGQRYVDVFSDLFWKPMRAERSAEITVDRLGAPRCAGGISMVLRDLARVGQMIAAGGRGVVPTSWIEDIAYNGDPGAWDRGSFAQEFPDIPMHYRSKWYVLRDNGPTLFCLGIHGQNLFVDLKSGLVLARVNSRPQPLDFAGERMTIGLFQSLQNMA